MFRQISEAASGLALLLTRVAWLIRARVKISKEPFVSIGGERPGCDMLAAVRQLLLDRFHVRAHIIV